MSAPRVDTLVFGGGVAGLWTLHALLDQGIDAWLVETGGLGGMQSMQAQGIVHGGGKYALRRVGDVAAIQQIREMPQRWREHRAGTRKPSLASATVNSDECWLWLPRGSWRARLEAVTLIPLLRTGGMLAAAPRARPRATWPTPLQQHAHRAYSMDEPVFDPGSVIRALVAPVDDRLLQVEEPSAIRRDSHGFTVEFPDGRSLRARFLVACAGEGNARILELAGHDPGRMQRRGLRMGLLRGDLPALHGHCVLGGRTRMSITSVDPEDGKRIWQIGGELAERWAATSDDEFFLALRRELDQALPGLDLSGIEFADYAAVRAEAANEEIRRPSGVQVSELQPGFVLAWPTKLAMAPLLAEEVVKMVAPGAGEAGDAPAEWNRARMGVPPWERASWRSVNSVQPG
jgi:glycine/D-amino acid oxidase-like deaminating enzyme